MSAGVVYLDSSALVKLVTPEAESEPLRAWLAERPTQLTSRVGAVELSRAALRRGGSAPERARAVLGRVDIIELIPPVATEAGRALPPELRTLDAIHLASAMELGDELDAFVTYDGRLAEAAYAAGLAVAMPGMTSVSGPD